MPKVGTKQASRLLPIAVDSAVLIGLFLGTLGPSGAPLATNLRTSALSHASTNGSEANFTVDPPSYGIRTGSNVTLQGVWSTASPRCNVTPLWYRWSVEEGNATGFLNGSNDPSTTFLADSFSSGTLRVVARAGAVLDCGMGESVVERTSGTNVTVVVPLAVTGVELGPNPLLPGGIATLTGRVTGGEPPYVLDVAWGDGAHSSVPLPWSGGFAVDHRFPAGAFVPTLLVSDSGGDLARVSVSEILSVGSGLEVAIAPASYVAEVGVPVDFVGTVAGTSSGTVVLFDCSNATVGAATPLSVTRNETAFSCTFTSPGTAEVLFGAYSSQPGGASASVVLYEPVVLPPRVSVVPVTSLEEVGGTELAEVRVSDGVPPISLVWNMTGNVSGGQEAVWPDGGGVISLLVGTPGSYAIGIRASDGLGSLDSNISATVRVAPSLKADAAGVSSPRSYGTLVEVGGDALSGCSPFSWWVVPELASSNGSAQYGSLGSIGRFAWNGGYAREGNLSIAAGIADACGAIWHSGLVVPLVASLSVDVAATPGPATPNETLAFNLTLRGGLGPFRLDVGASDHESWNRTVSSDGTYRWLLSTHANGTIELGVSVVDGLGGSVQTNLSVSLVRPPSPPPSPPARTPPPTIVPGPSGDGTASSAIDPGWLLAPVVLIGGSVGAVLLLRRRRTQRERQSTPSPDPVETLRRIIEPADGAERFTVELMAEEAGIPLALVRSTIDRLVSEGAVHSESGADGEEVLSWSSQSGR